MKNHNFIIKTGNYHAGRVLSNNPRPAFWIRPPSGEVRIQVKFSVYTSLQGPSAGPVAHNFFSYWRHIVDPAVTDLFSSYNS